MLTPQQLQNLPKGLTDMYSELSEFVLRDIARRISGAAKITDTAEYQMYRARALGMSTKEITSEIARISGISENKIRELILDAAQKSNEFDAKMLTGNDGSAIPLKDNKQLQKLMAAQIKQTNGACRNFTGTLGFAEIDANGQVVYSSMTDFLRKQMDMAQMKVASGVTDYNTAIRQACNTLAESGLRTVYYASGRSDRIEVAVRRALMTNVAQVTQKISEQNAEEFGADGWEISAHVGARPSHAIYQGRQYPNSQYETIVLPLINDYNCRHSAYPIVMGVTKPAYTEEQLRALDPPPFTYEGKQYTAYKAQQQMRKMERVMRKQKDRCIVADAAGDTETFTAASIKLRRQKDIYEDFCKAAGTYTEYERTFVTGYNRHLAGKTGAVTRRQNKLKNSQITLTDLENGGIIKKAKTINEAEKTAGKYASTVSFGGATNLDALNELNDTLDRLYGKYKIASLDTITVKSNKSREWASANYCTLNIQAKFINDPLGAIKSSTIDWTVEQENTLSKWKKYLDGLNSELGKENFSESYLKKQISLSKKTIRELEDNLKYSRHNAVYAGKEIRSVITHEFGHVIADQKIFQINPSRKGTQFAYNKDNLFWQKCEMVKDVFEQAKSNGDIYKISKYASKNEKEFFAECFCIYDFGIEQLPDYIIKMIEEVVGL